MISVYFLCLPHLVQRFFSSTRRMLLSFQPMGDMLEFCLEITKEDCLFIRIVYWDSRNLSSLSTLTEIFFVTFVKMLYFSTLLKTALLFCYPVWIVKSHLRRRDTISFLLPIFLPDYTAVSAGLGLLPTMGLYRVCDTMELVQLKSSRHYWTTNISSTPSTKKTKLPGKSNLWKLWNQVLESLSWQNTSC